MLRLPNAIIAHRKLREINNNNKVTCEDKMDVQTSEQPAVNEEPAAKKSKQTDGGERPATPETEASPERKRKDASLRHAAELAERERQRLLLLKRKHAQTLRTVVNYTVRLRARLTGVRAQMAAAMASGLMTDKSKKRRKQKKRPADQVGGPVTKVKKENFADEGVGSLVDLLDVMSVEDTPRGTATVMSELGRDMHRAVPWRARCNDDCRQVAAMNALRATVIVEDIPIDAFHDYETHLSELFSASGNIIRFGCPGFGRGTDTFSIAIHFETEPAAVKALEKDRTPYANGAIRVRRPGPLEPECAVAYSLVPFCTDVAARLSRDPSDLDCCGAGPSPPVADPWVLRNSYRDCSVFEDTDSE